MKLWTDPHQSFPLTSIILVTYNKVEFTLRCIESIYEHTEVDFEVIVVDNDSSDTTVEDLQALDHPGLRVIANPTNDGFGRGCNIGAEAALGDYLVFLNNDTLVCPGWLRRMLLKFDAHPQLGMVGPLTNVASNAQLVDQADTQSPANYHEHAARLAKEHEGEMIFERRLIGFCLVIPKRIWDQVEAFDERYGIGHYEDDDLCAKVSQAGYMLAVAKDVYVYHFHGKSFDGAGVARIAHMRDKAFLFYKKWGNAYLDWPDLLVNLSELTHVVTVVDDPAWIAPKWEAEQPRHLLSAVSRRGAPEVETALRDALQKDQIFSYRIAERTRPLGESYNVGMASHRATGQLLLGDPREDPSPMLRHIDADHERPHATAYYRHTAEGQRLIAYYLSSTALDRVGGLEGSGVDLEELVSAHLRLVRDAGLAVQHVTLTGADTFDQVAFEPPFRAEEFNPKHSQRNRGQQGSIFSAWLRARWSQFATWQTARTGWRAPEAVQREHSGELVNITMLSYNRLDFTQQSIGALRENTRHPYKLVVVDNGSDDETVTWLKEAKRDGRIDILVLNEKNLGVAPAANQGWLACAAPYYVKLDNDIVLTEEQWLADLVRVSSTVADAGMVGYNFEETSYPIALRQGVRVRPRPAHLGGACVLLNAKAHATAGYWCEDYSPYSEEDFDMGYRLELAGFRSYYMANEDVGLHLPHGRATRLVESQAGWASQDDEGDPSYRLFKDAARDQHVGLFSTVWVNCSQYRRQVRSLYFRPGPQQLSLRARWESAFFHGLRRVVLAFRPGR